MPNFESLGERMKVTISVAEEDIRQGVRGSCMRCPIANAANRTLGTLASMVYPIHTRWYLCTSRRGERRNFLLPEMAGEMAEYYDTTGFMPPFSFEVEL